MARIPRCCGSGAGWQLQLRLDPQPGNLHIPRERPKKWQKKTKKKKKGTYKASYLNNAMVIGDGPSAELRLSEPPSPYQATCCSSSDSACPSPAEMFFFFCFLFLSFVFLLLLLLFLGPLPRHTEVPRLGVELEL